MGRGRRAACELRDGSAGRVLAVACDTGDDHVVSGMVAEMMAEFGAVDILVNCAARVNTGAMHDEDLDEEINVTIADSCHSDRGGVRRMRRRRRGCLTVC